MADVYSILLPLIFGFVLDLLIGDPYNMPHPIRLFGNAISFSEQQWNKGQSRILKGALVTLVLVGFAYALFYLLAYFTAKNDYLFITITTVFVFYGLANRTLFKEALKVEKELTEKGVEAGRKQLRFIVGRDTSNLNENQIRTAVLETLAENLSDGVIAPLFYYALGGVPLMFAYKMINTLDSMIGYKNARYKDFGFFAAKLDDVANFVPARITALLMSIVTFNYRSLVFILRYGNKHASPNAGYPEAALAGILICRFGGPNVYHGTLVDKPFIGNNDRNITAKDIKKACLINLASSLLFVLIIVYMLLRLI